MEETHYRIFKQGSKTYFFSSIFFPKEIKEDVFILYSFVRKADDLVDSVPQREREFRELERNYHKALEGRPSGDLVVDSFADLVKRKNFEREWVDGFLRSMGMDLEVSEYRTLEDLDTYLYGSSEVIGLMMAAIMDLPPESHHHARHLGKAMQYINFIRDIDEDLAYDRTYFPREELDEYGLDDLSPDTASRFPYRFDSFMKAQIERYMEWQAIAEEGFKYIPRRCLIPIRTASEMYRWTGKVIGRNPHIVYRRKVKPSVPRLLARIAFDTIVPS